VPVCDGNHAYVYFEKEPRAAFSGEVADEG